MMRSGYDLEDLDDAIFGAEIRRRLASQRCPKEGCSGELRWTSPTRTLQLGQTVTLTGTCAQCGGHYELELRL
jgi:hypothetical protein